MAGGGGDRGGGRLRGTRAHIRGPLLSAHTQGPTVSTYGPQSLHFQISPFVILEEYTLSSPKNHIATKGTTFFLALHNGTQNQKKGAGYH